MKIIIETERGRGGKPVLMLIEDNGTDYGGRIVARFYRHEDAIQVCERMGWTVTEDNYAAPKLKPI